MAIKKIVCKRCGVRFIEEEGKEKELALNGCRKGYCSHACCVADFPSDNPNEQPQCPCW